MGNLADFVNKIAFCLAIGLMPRAAPWNQPSKVHSLVEFHEGLSQTLVCVLFSHAFCRRPCSRGQSMHFSFSWTQSVPLPHVFSASTIVLLRQSTLHDNDLYQWGSSKLDLGMM